MAMIPTMLFSFCSLLMASMFAYSASVQLNDPDLNQRLVREKTGSGLVVISMILHIKTSSPSPNPKQPKLPRFVEYGMAGLVGFSYGFPFFFFAILKKEMKL
ncbi:uncharacterized protein LOC110820075 isoform X2 [Carica papaya]|uniref:uncharacterized protein LOC110820075 isoform X2 n=1 Tax=Carica papaya TaxID=3649 RepID=UPI000B8CA578|nr:uncharacterized protein LOC110820075 isoform X2 [Carica papaya]